MIPDDVVEGYLKVLFGNSEPGQVLHHLLIAAAPAAEHTALGLPPTDRLHVTVYAIAPDGDVDAAQFVARTIRTAIAEAQQNRTVIYFAGLAMEVHVVADDGDEVTENLARRMIADRQLYDHPAAIEMTLLYAASRDGRRWIGEHLLTGDRAGTIEGPELRVGTIGSQEAGVHRRLVRTAVGLA